jgi:hypothetical protein
MIRLGSRRHGAVLLASSVAAAALMSAGPAGAAYRNLAGSSPQVTGTGTPCSLLNSGPRKAVDGRWSNIYIDKWCVLSGTGQARLNIKLQHPNNLLATNLNYAIDKIVIKHAGIAGESVKYNTRAYRLRFGQNSPEIWGHLLTTWRDGPIVTNNTLNTTEHIFPSLEYAMCVELIIDQGAQPGYANATRIYEVEVWGWVD